MVYVCAYAFLHIHTYTYSYTYIHKHIHTYIHTYIHRRWSYNRIGTMVCYFFYKNITFALVLFWYSLANAFSAQPLYDDGYQSLYNVLFTSLPVMTFAVSVTWKFVTVIYMMMILSVCTYSTGILRPLCMYVCSIYSCACACRCLTVFLSLNSLLLI